MESKENPTFFQLSIFGVFLLFSIVSQLVIVIQILKQNWQELKPINIHQVNYFAGLALINISGIHLVLSKAFDDPLDFCPAHILSHIFLISNKYDIIILQIDRLLAIKNPYYYKEVVHVKESVKVVLVSKLFSVFIAVISSIIDPYFLYCPSCGMCTFIQSVYVYTVSYPAIAAFILTVCVSIYVFFIMNKLNSIQPLVSLPVTSLVINVLPVNQETLSSSQNNNFGISPEQESGGRPEENECIDEVGDIREEDQMRHTADGEILISVVDTCQEDIGSRSSDEINVLKMLTEIESKNMVTPERNINMSHEPDMPTEAHKNVLLRTLKMNLFTLAILFIAVPTSVLNIIFENCNHLSGECDLYFDIMIVSSLCELVIGFLQPIVYLFFLEPNS